MTNTPTILIVEDDPDLNKMLTGYFHDQGYDVRSALWGEEGVQLAIELLPDLIVQDVRLPDINGFEVVRRLRANRQTYYTPVIFLTDQRDKESRMSGLELGAICYMNKPFELTELRLRVRNVLKRVEEGSALNAITRLPQVNSFEPYVTKILGASDWGAVFVGLNGLGPFKERYGFLATDDVIRAVGLILTQSLNQELNPDDFFGHFDYSEFLVLSSRAKVDKLAALCRSELGAAIPKFYPEKDQQRLRERPASEQLSIQVSVCDAGKTPVESIPELQSVLRSAAALHS